MLMGMEMDMAMEEGWLETEYMHIAHPLDIMVMMLMEISMMMIVMEMVVVIRLA